MRSLPPAPRPLELGPGQPAEPPRTWHMPPATAETPDSAAEVRARDEARESGVPWEVEAMTTPDYTAPRSIHDPEHDSWPVSTQPGDAAPAWDDGTDDGEEVLELSDGVRDILELTEDIAAQLELTDTVDEELDLTDAVEDSPLELTETVDEQVVAKDAAASDAATGEARPALDETQEELPWVDGPSEPPSTFPLDAFIVPGGIDHLPVGFVDEVGGVVADRLEALARQIREDGIATIGQAQTPDELSRVLGAIVTGYLARRN